MLKGANWTWVREWAQRIFVAMLPLTVFGYLSVSPVVRPGGVISALPSALLFAIAVSVPATLVAAGLLALYSARKGGRHDG